jgi:hypothetical protein
MSKQFSMLMTDVDLQTLEKLLRDSGDVDLLSTSPTKDDQGLLPLTSLPIPLSEAGKVPLSCYLVPRNQPPIVAVRRLSPVKVAVDDQRSHLINFMRPYFNGQVVRRGRFYYQNWIVESGAWVAKNADFCRWADRVFARVKRTLQFDKRQDAYLGKDAAERIAAGTVTPD